jgi:hypothetical protein
MSFVNRPPADLIPQNEMKTFMDELSRVTDRETFNSLMKRFDESFMQRYQTSGKEEKGKFPFGAAQETVKTAYQQPRSYSNLPSFYQAEPAVQTGDPRMFRYPQEAYPYPGPQSEQYPKYREDPYNPIYRPKINEDIYGSNLNQPRYLDERYNYPPFNPIVEDRHSAPLYPKYAEDKYSPYSQPKFVEDKYSVPMYTRNYPGENLEKPPGYMRTEYIPYPQHQPYGPPPRNPIQESVDLRKVKEDLLTQSRIPEPKLENITLPPPRYDVPLYESQPSYFPQNQKSFYTRN